MPALPSDCVKVIYIRLYMCKCNKSTTLDDFAKSLECQGRVNAALVLLENEELLVRTHTGITFTNVKDRLLSSLYRRKKNPRLTRHCLILNTINAGLNVYSR